MVHMHRARGKEVLAVMVLAAEYPWEKEERMLLTAVPCTVIIFTISVIEVLNARSLPLSSAASFSCFSRCSSSSSPRLFTSSWSSTIL